MTFYLSTFIRGELMDCSDLSTLITACGSGLRLHVKITRSRSIKSKSLGLGSGHEYFLKIPLGGSDLEPGLRILGPD